MKIKILAGGSTQWEHRIKKMGLAFIIDDDLLFDTFCSGPLLEMNLQKQHTGIENIKHIVLSHEHWDHTGGLWWILEKYKGIKVYLCSRFSAAFKQKVEEHGGVPVEVTKPMQIRENVFTTGEIAGSYNSEPLYEQALILKQRDKIAVITGCSHPGILKILTYIGLEHKEKIDFLIGGLHLLNKSPAEIAGIATILDAIYQIEHIAPFHCTGEKALHYFKKHMPKRFIKVRSGDEFAFNPETVSWEQVK